MKNVIILLAFSAFIISCNNSKNKASSSFEKQIKANKHPGKKLMETNCYTCHSPTASHDARIGPPMIAIKKHYIVDDTTKEQFISAMQAWIKNPNEDDAKMFGAVKRFGIMPKQHFPEETIKQIADYMYDFDIDQPEWFEDHFDEERLKNKGYSLRNGKGINKQKAEVKLQDLPYDERGLKYALTTKAVLGKNLMGTIQKNGTLDALDFCNANAYPLTDSMATVHNAKIKRVSDKPRNQNNQANDKELTYINAFKKEIKNNNEPKPIVDEVKNKVYVYYPITTNAMCLQCHGKPYQDIKKPIINKLATFYPEDKAIGYGVNAVRGVWSVSFDK